MHFNLVAERVRGQAARLCKGLIDPGQLYIGVESRQSSCATGKLILAAMVIHLDRLFGCAMG